MGAFAGLLVVAAVLWFWLRRLARIHAAFGAAVEAGLNRAASNRGETPISDDVDRARIF